MRMSFLHMAAILVALHASYADINSLEKKVDGLETLISTMQTFVLQDMISIKGKLADTDRKLEELSNKIDHLQSPERTVGFTEADISRISDKVIQRNHKDMAQMSTAVATVSNVLIRIKRGFASEKHSLLNEVNSLKETTANVQAAVRDMFVNMNKTIDTMVTLASDNIAEAVKKESRRATRVLKDTFNSCGDYVKQISGSIMSVEFNISSKLDNKVTNRLDSISSEYANLKNDLNVHDKKIMMSLQKVELNISSKFLDRDNEVINRLYNISSEYINLKNDLNSHDQKMMFSHRFTEYLRIGGTNYIFHVPHAQARLANATLYGTTGVQGRLEVYLGNEWGTVCDNAFDTKQTPTYSEIAEETVACRTLGAGFTRGLALPGNPFGQSTGRMVMRKNCDGHEDSLFECPDSGDLNNCGHEREVHIRCFE